MGTLALLAEAYLEAQWDRIQTGDDSDETEAIRAAMIEEADGDHDAIMEALEEAGADSVEVASWDPYSDGPLD